MTKTLLCAAATVALTASAAMAGSTGAYSLSPQSYTGTTTYVQPQPTFIPQPTATTTETLGTVTTTTTSQPEVGQIIYNTEPYTGPTTTLSTESYGTTTYGTTTETMTYDSGTSGSYAAGANTTGIGGSNEDVSENGSYVSSPIVGGNNTSGF